LRDTQPANLLRGHRVIPVDKHTSRRGRLMFRKRLSYANVTASLALFVALGGTAAAAVTLPRDSVGSPQIRKGAVRSAEIGKDAVRSSEIRDSGIRLADIADGARRALRGAQGPAGPAGPQGPAGTTNVRIAEEDFAEVPLCPGTELLHCENLVELSLGSAAPDDARNWLIQAKLTINTPDGSASNFSTGCGLVMAENQSPTAVIDDVRVGALPNESEPKAVVLSGVVGTRFRNPLMAVRCTMEQFDEIDVADMTLTAIEVGTLTGP